MITYESLTCNGYGGVSDHEDDGEGYANYRNEKGFNEFPYGWEGSK